MTKYPKTTNNSNLYLAVPHWLLKMPDVTPLEKLILAQIWSWENCKGCRGSNAKFAKLLGSTPKAISCAISRLTKRGLVLLSYPESRRMITIVGAPQVEDTPPQTEADPPQLEANPPQPPDHIIYKNIDSRSSSKKSVEPSLTPYSWLKAKKVPLKPRPFIDEPSCVFLTDAEWERKQKKLGELCLQSIIDAITYWTTTGNGKKLFLERVDHNLLIDTFHRREISSGKSWSNTHPNGPGYYPNWDIRQQEKNK